MFLAQNYRFTPQSERIGSYIIKNRADHKCFCARLPQDKTKENENLIKFRKKSENCRTCVVSFSDTVSVSIRK